MKKIFVLLVIIIFSVTLSGCGNKKDQTQVNENLQQQEENDKKAVTSLVESFGKKLQVVSLLADKDVVSKSMQENYSDFVSPALLAKFQSHPENAPGRMVSSPWPDRIEIKSIEKISEGIYKVKGEIIEITSLEQTKSGVAEKRPIILEVKKMDNKWLIDAVNLEDYQGFDSVKYKNTQYGFNFYLPESWKNFTITTEKWLGIDIQSQKTIETGLIIYIRHPKWTSKNKMQDIPIMVFTLAQWEALQQEKFHIGAAPIGPSKLGGNSKYIFALPARYNYAFPTGYEEVENILKNNPLQPFLLPST